MTSTDEVAKALAEHEPNERDLKIVELAQMRYPRDLEDGDLDVDANAMVSEGDENGAYVSAWLWVSFAGTELDKEKQTD